MLSEDNARLTALRRIWTLVVLMALIGALGAGPAEAKQKPKAPPPPPANLPGRVSDLAWQLRGVHIDDSAPITDQIQKLVIDHLQEWLANRSATGVEVRRELEAVFSKLRYPTYGQPACFAEPWKGGTLIGAGYTLGWTNFSRVNVVTLFEHRQGKSRLAALTQFVPFTDLQYEFLPARGTDDFWFFIYGTRPGKSQPRLSAILYAFDGQTLKSLWETHDLLDGKMDVGAEKVTIRYLKEDEYVREMAHGRKPPRHQAIHRITPQGLELESDKEIPF
jgi:hypothetical protein